MIITEAGAFALWVWHLTLLECREVPSGYAGAASVRGHEAMDLLAEKHGVKL